MPIYVFECGKCHDIYEMVVTLKSTKFKCPKCESKNVKKIPAKGTFQLKGNGWAKDGYK